MHLIFIFLFFILIFVLVIGVSIIARIINMGRRFTDLFRPKKRAGNSSSSYNSPQSTTNKEKVFGDDEGEYVDYEEVD